MDEIKEQLYKQIIETQRGTIETMKVQLELKELYIQLLKGKQIK